MSDYRLVFGAAVLVALALIAWGAWTAGQRDEAARDAGCRARFHAARTALDTARVLDANPACEWTLAEAPRAPGYPPFGVEVTTSDPR